MTCRLTAVAPLAALECSTRVDDEKLRRRVREEVRRELLSFFNFSATR
jgi:hypothetical protein